MKFIGITLERCFAGEAHLIEEALLLGVDLLHVRKPEESESQVAQLLREVGEEYHERLVLHDCFALVGQFPRIGGVHLSRRNSVVPEGFSGRVSSSCHTLQEVERSRDMEYRFLSPIYNSISKAGYESRFTQRELNEARERGIIDERVIALGGVTLARVEELRRFGFGGVALLGYLWEEREEVAFRGRVMAVREALDRE